MKKVSSIQNLLGKGERASGALKNAFALVAAAVPVIKFVIPRISFYVTSSQISGAMSNESMAVTAHVLSVIEATFSLIKIYHEGNKNNDDSNKMDMNGGMAPA